MSVLTILGLLLLGILIWYVLFGFECALNGAAMHPGNPWLMPFRELWHDLTQEAPGGLLYAVFMHLVVPGSPLLIWLKFFR